MRWLPLLILLLWLGNVNPVSAHATLVRSDPVDSATLSDAPRAVYLWFDEPVAARFSTVRLFDAKNQAIPVVSVVSDPDDPNALIITLAELPHGVYSLLYKVLAQSDGHYSQGSLVFGIGATVEEQRAQGGAVAVVPPWPEVLLRWLNLWLLTGMIGALAMVQLLLGPTPERRYISVAIRRLARRRVLTLALSMAGVLLLVGLGTVSWQYAVLRNSLPDTLRAPAVLRQVVMETQWGRLWVARQSVMLVLTLLLFALCRRDLRRHGRHDHRAIGALWWGIGTLIPLLLLVQSLTSHAASVTHHQPLAVAVDMVHLLAAALWVGGLLALAVGLLLFLPQRKRLLLVLVANTWRSFSAIAAFSVLLLIGTGLYSTGRQVVSLDALITTLYGRFLIAKVFLVLLVSGCGLLNSLILHPQLTKWLPWRRGAVTQPFLPLQRLPVLVTAEVGLALCVLLATGLVTASAAPRGAEYTVAAEDVPTALSQSVDDLMITLGIKPNRPGRNVFTIFAGSKLRPPAANIMRVIVRMRHLEQDTGLLEVDADLIEPDRYLVTSNYLSLPGPWEINVIVRRQGVEDSVARFYWLTPPPGQVKPVVLSKYPWQPALTQIAVLLLLAMLIVGGGLEWRRRTNLGRGAATSPRARQNIPEDGVPSAPVARESLGVTIRS